MNEMMRVSHSIPLGTMAFLLDVEQLFVRVDQGWQEVMVRYPIVHGSGS